jgi:hypothetical protein
VPADPTGIRSIAVTTADVVAALELTLTSDDTGVLRLTPPFHGRMRARLHVDRGDGPPADTEPRPLYLPPERLVDDPPAYPRPDETAAQLRADPETTYTVERHHERHAAAVERWREAVPETIRDEVTLQTPEGTSTVSVSVLQAGLE